MAKHPFLKVHVLFVFETCFDTSDSSQDRGKQKTLAQLWASKNKVK